MYAYNRVVNTEDAKALIANPSEKVIAMNIGFIGDMLYLYLLNSKNQHFESYIIPYDAIEPGVLTTALERKGLAFGETKIYLNPNYEFNAGFTRTTSDVYIPKLTAA